MSGPRIVVTGGRRYPNRHLVFTVLSLIRPSAVAHGACPTKDGADWHADAWCQEANVPCDRYPARFHEQGRFDPSAGPRRNRYMLRDWRPELVLAFPGDRGTADCCAAAEQLGIPVLSVR